jgi:hypothetical protein
MIKGNKIAICGLAGSGKETFAKMIRLCLYNKAYGTDYKYKDYHKIGQQDGDFDSCEIVHFATPLKEMAAMIEGVDVSVYSDRETKESRRPILLRLSDSLKKEFGEHVIFDIAIRRLSNPTKFYIIEDLRLSIEENYLKENNSFIVKISRPNNEQINNHITETHCASIKEDTIILNDGDFDSLFEKARFITNMIEFKFLLQ